VFASADIYYSLGAIAAGILISRIFKNMSTVLSIIILMIIAIAILLMVTFSQTVGIFYLFSFLLGVTNAGARVQRVTYLFHHVGNYIIGRTNSVFSVINIFLRSVFIALFSLPFFATGNNAVWGFFILAVFILVSVIPLIVKYKDLREMKIET
jgi:MFS family permease